MVDYTQQLNSKLLEWTSGELEDFIQRRSPRRYPGFYKINVIKNVKIGNNEAFGEFEGEIFECRITKKEVLTLKYLLLLS